MSIFLLAAHRYRRWCLIICKYNSYRAISSILADIIVACARFNRNASFWNWTMLKTNQNQMNLLDYIYICIEIKAYLMRDDRCCIFYWQQIHAWPIHAHPSQFSFNTYSWAFKEIWLQNISANLMRTRVERNDLVESPSSGYYIYIYIYVYVWSVAECGRVRARTHVFLSPIHSHFKQVYW